jgi:diguanylate cyclase (GGDEF)-like protein/putative nucleotidyltransferase with HDIG domain
MLPMGDARGEQAPYGAPVPPPHTEPAAAGRFVVDRSDLLARESAARTLSRGRILAVVALGVIAAAAAATTLRSSPSGHDWLTFAALAAAATIAQAFPVQSSRNLLYHTTVVFLVAAALLLPPQLLVLIPLAQILPGWARERRPWILQGFDAANYTVNAVTAWGAAHLVQTRGAALVPHAEPRFALAGLAACVAFVASNHLVVAAVVRGPIGRRFRETGLFTLESLSVDLVLTVLGISLAAFWELNPWLVFAALAPLLVVHRSLSVPRLQAEARIDAKTGLYNARWFSTALAAELARAARFERPMAVIMADLDLLRDVNNTHGHLAGDAVLRGVAEVFQRELRHYDVPARFGGEEFSILLPETSAEQAVEIAERIRRAVAERQFDVPTAAGPVRATVSLGVAAYPQDGLDANELVHQADLAVYRAKLQGRNRVLGVSVEPMLFADGRPSGGAAARPAPLHAVAPAVTAANAVPDDDEHAPTARHELPRLHLRVPGVHLALLVAAVGAAGAAAGMLGLVHSGMRDLVGLVAITTLVAGSQALSTELTDVAGSISVAVVVSLAGAALFDYGVALPIALASAAVEWSIRRGSLHQSIYTIGTVSLSSLAAAALFRADRLMSGSTLVHALAGVAAGGVYFAVSMSLLSVASALETGESPASVFRERCGWLLPHYLVYGFIGGVIAVAYDAVGIYALAVFAVPLLLMRNTQAAFVSHAQRSARKLRAAADTIQAQNVSLEEANRLLRERSNAAMESLSATVDARDSYTAGHSRRVQQLALAVGRELGLSQAELALLDRAALFHDIGKLAVPDAILLKPGGLTREEWTLMQSHAEEGARIIERLGFLQDAVPAIRHHHERWDGTGYPDRIGGDEIPLGARIIHVADALDSMLTTRIYRAARPLEDALEEIRDASGTQFCPRCVAALERLLPIDAPTAELSALVAV